MLTVDHVTKKYGNFTALEDINLEFGNGIYGLLAPNGAGKTTLIKMLTTLLFPTRGEILYNGTDIQLLDEDYRAIIGYLPQQFGYYKNYSPRQFLRYLAALKGIDKKIAEGRIDELFHTVSLSDVADKKMRKFSGGMLQRVGIAQAMLNDPGILILDEPTAGLDPKERVRFRNIISALAHDRIIILSTHIVSDIETVANKVQGAHRISLALMSLPLALPSGGLPFFLSVLSPVSLWYLEPVWLTDGGGQTLWPYFETIGIVGCFVLLSIGSLPAVRYFNRKDIL